MPPPSPFPYLAFAALNIYTLKAVNDVAHVPYMDEPFHVPQAQAYCSGNFTSYDPKLTTPPGLYLLSVALSRVFLIPCKLATLRLTCTLLLLALPPLLAHLLPMAKPPPRDEPPRTLSASLSPRWEAIILASFPVMWFFGFLYYTDLGAVVCAVACVVYARRENAGTAALVGALGVLFRQTNIIWMMYALSLQAFNILQRPPPNGTPSAYHLVDPSLSILTASMFVQSIQSLFSAAFARIPELLTRLWPYIPPMLSFAGFVVWNNGIALGDRTHHIPTPHLVLPLYFLAFATAFALPVLLNGPLGTIGLAKVVATKMFGGVRRATVTAIATALLMIAVHFFSIAHPFLLADNRHYPFYIWRRVFMFHPAMPYLFVPGYIACFWIWVARLSSHTLLPLLSLTICTLLVLIPTPLLEPRYFIIPYLLFRTQVETTPVGVVLEGVLYGVVNLVTMKTFLDMPFDGGWGEGLGRLMW